MREGEGAGEKEQEEQEEEEDQHGEDKQAAEDQKEQEETGSKRTIESVMKWLREHGHDTEAIWDRIGTLVNKTLIAIQPKLAHSYRTCFPRGDSDANCFEILGFDVMLDAQLKPWLIEVNHSPSFNTDEEIDVRCKSKLVHDALKLVNIKKSAKTNYVKQLRAGFAQRNMKSVVGGVIEQV